MKFKRVLVQFVLLYNYRQIYSTCFSFRVKREFMFMYIFKRGAWLQLESISDRYDSINTLVMSLATSTLSFTVDGQEILARLRYPVYT